MSFEGTLYLEVTPNNGQATDVSIDKLTTELKSSNHIAIYDASGLLSIMLSPQQHSPICISCLSSRIKLDGRCLNVPNSYDVGKRKEIVESIINSELGKLLEASTTFFRCINATPSNAEVAVTAILPMPDCKHCIGRAIHSTEQHSLIKPGGMLEDRLALGLLTPVGSLLGKASCQPLEMKAMQAPVWISKVSYALELEHNAVLASGKGYTRCSAMASGIGEALEHYAYTIRNQQDHDDDSNKPLDSTNSGWAIHIDKEHAIENALNERVERDAFLCSWVMKSSGLPIALETHSDPIVVDTIKYCNQLGFAVTAFSLHTDLPRHVILVVLWHARRKDSSPSSIFGASCSKDVSSAARDALLEAMQMIPAIQHHSQLAMPIGANIQQSPSIHGRYYGQSLRSKLLSHWIENREARYSVDMFTPYSESTDTLCELAGLDIIDRTPPDLALLGICAVSTSVGKIASMYFGSSIPKANLERAKRLYSVTDIVNSEPLHPFC